jgi:hypothetical protein
MRLLVNDVPGNDPHVFPRDIIDKPHCNLDLNDLKFFKVLIHFGCEAL